MTVADSPSSARDLRPQQSQVPAETGLHSEVKEPLSILNRVTRLIDSHR
jgi:hypothetical protein